jgi:hypothetical protein
VDDKKDTLQDYKTLRKEFLGDGGPENPYDGDIANSDHAAIMVTIHPVK